MIDIAYAREEFARFLKGFDQKDDKIKLKIVHTYGVVACSREIARRMGLSEEDCRLAELIALLHDIGRFEQVTRFGSFERSLMDHASYGVELLFGEEQMIRRFVKEDTWDAIIRISIARHSDYALPEIADTRALLHARLIRDADKLDNCRVKLEEPIRVLLGMEASEVGGFEISPQIWQSCLEHRSVRSEERRTKMDYWVSYIAYFYDINFPETMDMIREEKYIDRIIDRIPYSNPATAEKMEMLRKIV